MDIMVHVNAAKQGASVLNFTQMQQIKNMILQKTMAIYATVLLKNNVKKHMVLMNAKN